PQAGHHLAPGILVAHVAIDVDRTRPAVVGGDEAALEAVESRRTRLDAQPLRQRSPAVAVMALPLADHVAARAPDDLRDGAGVVDIARRPAGLQQLDHERPRRGVV